VPAAYGRQFYADALTLARRLPPPHGATETVVVLRLRWHRKLGATIVSGLGTYADRLGAAGGRLYLSGVDDDVRDLPRRTGKVDLSDTVKIDLATSVIGESRRRADDDATAWPLEPHAVRQPNAVREPDDA
jgi:SulP family sulfate permease